jgi:hypothetical protein
MIDLKEILENESVKYYLKKQEKLTNFSTKAKSIQAQLELVTKHPWCIKHLVSPPEEIQIRAVEEDPNIIRFIYNPSQKVQLVAVLERPVTIVHISHPTRYVQLMAIKTSLDFGKSYITDILDCISHDIKQELIVHLKHFLK